MLSTNAAAEGVDFSTLGYLKGVNSDAYSALQRLGLFPALAALGHAPLLAGTFPIGLAKVGSDLDVVLRCAPEGFGGLVEAVAACVGAAVRGDGGVGGVSGSACVNGVESGGGMASGDSARVTVFMRDGDGLEVREEKCGGAHMHVAGAGAEGGAEANAEGGVVALHCQVDAVRGFLSLSIDFDLFGFAFGLFAQDAPSAEQHAYRHMLIEHRLLCLLGDDFRGAVRRLREGGLKTEPAFAAALGSAFWAAVIGAVGGEVESEAIPKDPYAALLLLEDFSDDVLREAFAAVAH